MTSERLVDVSQKLEPTVRIELTTYGLRNRCSTS